MAWPGIQTRFTLIFDGFRGCRGGVIREKLPLCGTKLLPTFFLKFLFWDEQELTQSVHTL